MEGEQAMKSYTYLGITYHEKNGFYYIKGVSMKFKTHELIHDWITDYQWGHL